MVCLNKITLLVIGGISLHFDASETIVDKEQHLILGIAGKCGPPRSLCVLYLNCVRVKGVDE